MTLRNSELMKLMAHMLMSSRTSVTLSVLETGRKPVIQTAVLRAPISTTLGNLMDATTLQFTIALASLTLPVVIAITHTKTTINIAQAGNAMMTVKTTIQTEIAITIAKAAALQTNIATVIDMAII
eukprot:14238591-Ditylum_brightwellii.AAC.1